MANVLPEVVPRVSNMSTDGWYCQTDGAARRRIVANLGSATEPVFQVAGVPGFTHNASAVIDVDADYTRFRTHAESVAAGVFGEDPDGILFEAGELVDSVLPDDAEERYDRCVERCVKSIELIPENCTGNITEPTRAIGEVRTLVTRKSRLDTLTYVEETQGWVFPQDANDETTPARVFASSTSNFPDVYVDMTNTALQGAYPASVTVPSRTYMKDTAAGGTVFFNVLGLGEDWDGTIRFRWDGAERATRPPSRLRAPPAHWRTRPCDRPTTARAAATDRS